MIREVVKIDEELCNGCGECVPNCHEGALQIIDGKARLVSDLLCDGLGACIGHCPLGAITIEKREAKAYDEIKVMALMVEKGKNTVVAHLQHLKEHNEKEFLQQGVKYLQQHKEEIDFDIDEVIAGVHGKKHNHGQGCPGSGEMSFRPVITEHETVKSQPSALSQWPVQMHLINPMAGYFQKSDLLVAADCIAFSMGNFHRDHLNGKSLVIACPKLDSNTENYISKLTALVDQAQVNTITVMIMEVPCCGGLLSMVKQAVNNAQKKVPVKVIVVGIQGEILREQWT